MKTLLLYFISSLCVIFSNAQQNGSIRTKKITPSAGVENLYEYIPPQKLFIPEKPKASIIYFNKGYFKKTIPLTKMGDKYEFSFKAPDSTDVLVMTILDEHNNIADNNNEKGYVSYLYDSKGKLFISSKVTQAMLFNGYVNQFYKTKVPSSEVIKMYEEGFKINPGLEKGEVYRFYLSLLYYEKKDAAKPRLLSMAKQMLATKGDEDKWLSAREIYLILKIEQELKKTEAKILSSYPDGQLAIKNFWKNFFQMKDATEKTVLASMNDYEKRFGDSSTTTRNDFYMYLVDLSAKNKDWNAVLKYGALVDNKLWLASSYNNIAWGLSGEGLTAAGSDLEFAKIISKHSVDFVENKMSQTGDNYDSNELVGAHIGYTDTYALILYKLNNFDSAFYYQHAILQRGPMGVEGMERYAAYAEKSKGALFAKDFIEPQLLNGVNSPVMQKQLQLLYQQLNLPEEEFFKVKEKFTALAKKKTADIIIAKFGTQKGADFNLRDLQGKIVSLSSLREKVVVLDFWATWCGPCRASFPAMQDLVNKYKDDREVAFIFIDTWEQKDPKIMQENAAKFIKDNNYSFQVLLDEKDKVVGDYKVEGIPAKFVLDKKGNIIFMGEGGNDLALIIEAAKEY